MGAAEVPAVPAPGTCGDALAGAHRPPDPDLFVLWRQGVRPPKSRCSAMSASTDTRRTPISMPAHATGSSIHAATTVTTPRAPLRSARTARRYAAHCGGGQRDARRGDASDNGPRLPARDGQNDQEIATRRKNALFAGRESGARTRAILASLINTAKLNDLDPQTYLADVLERMISGRTPVSRLDELLAWHWKAARDALAPAAA